MILYSEALQKALDKANRSMASRGISIAARLSTTKRSLEFVDTSTGQSYTGPFIDELMDTLILEVCLRG